MNQAELRKLIPALRCVVQPKYRRFSNPKGQEGRLIMLRKTVTSLVKNERIELNYHRADEARGYAERLIGDAIRYGDRHRETMEMATYWLEEKQLVHKLFKVLVPRYTDSKDSYTRMYKAPIIYPGRAYERAVLELKDNPLPPVVPHTTTSHNWLHNILLEEARREYKAKKQEEYSE